MEENQDLSGDSNVLELETLSSRGKPIATTSLEVEDGLSSDCSDENVSESSTPIVRGRRGGKINLYIEESEFSDGNCIDVPKKSAGRGRRGGTINLDAEERQGLSSEYSDDSPLDAKRPRRRRKGAMSVDAERRKGPMSVDAERRQGLSSEFSEDNAVLDSIHCSKLSIEHAENHVDVKRRAVPRPCSVDHLASASSSRRGSSRRESSTQENTPSSRRSSMKLIQVNFMPGNHTTLAPPLDKVDISNPSVSDIEKRKRFFKSGKKKKKKKAEKVKPVKKHELKYGGGRRGGLLSGRDHEGDAGNGLSTDSSEETNALQSFENGGHSDSDSSVTSSSRHQPDQNEAALCVESGTKSRTASIDNNICNSSSPIIPRLKSLSRDDIFEDETVSTLADSQCLVHHKLLDVFSASNTAPYVYTPLAYENPAEVLQDKLLRKYSRSEFDLRTKCSSLFASQSLPQPILRQVSSDIELGYFESGV